MRIPVALSCLFLCSCGSQAHLRHMEYYGALRVDPPTASGEYTVTMKNLKEIGFDLDDSATRASTASAALATQCPSGAHVVGESVVTTGENLMGPTRTYAVRVRCG